MSARRARFPAAACLAAVVSWLGTAGAAEPAPALPAAGDRATAREQRMAWWREARFGLFVHWGVYAVPAGEYQGHKVPHLAEWIMNAARIPKEEYRKFAAGFDPKEYDARQWVAAAAKGGARYMVVTAKHHDGFAMFDSKVTDWDAVDATPGKRDLLGELAAACREARMPLGFHYSQSQDWWHPGGASYGKPWDASQAGNFDAYLDRVAIPQLRELAERYGPVACLFFDTPAKMTPDRARRIEAAVPVSTVVNDRIGGMAQWDYRCAENKMPHDTPPAPDWELCRTMNGTWGFRKEPTKWIPAGDLLRELVRTASLGGNYLLNVGPDAQGRFPEQAVERLGEIGAWLARFGDSVYGTRATPLPRQAWDGASTLKQSGDGWKLFLQVFRWPADGTLRVAGLADKPAAVELLGGAAGLEIDGVPGLWTIRGLPSEPVHEDVSVVALGFPTMPAVTRPPAELAPGQACVLKPDEATLSKGAARLGRSPSDPSQAIRDWKGPDGVVSWRVAVARPAQASLVLDISAPLLPADLTGTVSVDGAEVGVFTVPASESAARCKVSTKPFPVPAGVLVLSLRLTGTTDDPPMALYSVTFAPAAP